jgi:hypothetical protein
MDKFFKIFYVIMKENDSVDPPGPISNHTLLKSDGSPKEGLQRGINFRGTHQTNLNEEIHFRHLDK